MGISKFSKIQPFTEFVLVKAVFLRKTKSIHIWNSLIIYPRRLKAENMNGPAGFGPINSDNFSPHPKEAMIRAGD